MVKRIDQIKRKFSNRWLSNLFSTSLIDDYQICFLPLYIREVCSRKEISELKEEKEKLQTLNNDQKKIIQSLQDSYF